MVEDIIGFSATAEINREEYGLVWNVALDSGGFLVGKKVRIGANEFTVIGVMDKRPSIGAGGGQDDLVFDGVLTARGQRFRLEKKRTGASGARSLISFVRSRKRICCSLICISRTMTRFVISSRRADAFAIRLRSCEPRCDAPVRQPSSSPT